MEKGYNIVFSDFKDRDDALATLKAKEFRYQDTNYGETYTRVGEGCERH